ncbi:Unknown protein sequence [Pseudomonas syringae pv. tagetis]|uniref:Uncharacterized protein n=1 Tax=Pseudomonas syringae pv. tagetis TaxID=129140 RepID=A0A0Q0HLE0_9PSED|nr:Unknown protein sequence [Pseudomonas syringae pv. tagetis]
MITHDFQPQACDSEFVTCGVCGGSPELPDGVNRRCLHKARLY